MENKPLNKNWKKKYDYVFEKNIERFIFLAV